MSRLWDQRNNPIMYICGYYTLFVVITIVVLFGIYCGVTYWQNCKDILMPEERYQDSPAETQISIDKHMMMLDERDLYPDITSRIGFDLGNRGLTRYPDLVQLLKYNNREQSQTIVGRDSTRLYI